MNQSNDALMRMMIDIMEIQKEPENIECLKEWVHDVGIDVVFKKVIHMYSLNLA